MSVRTGALSFGLTAQRVRRLPLGIVIPLALILLAIGAWVASLDDFHLRQMNDLGLISVMPIGMMIAAIFLVVSYCLCLGQRDLNVPLLLLHIVILAIVLYATTAFVEPTSRFSITYRHLGYTEYILRTHQSNTRLDAYFNWPGFFILAAFFTQALAVPSLLALTSWAPLFFNLLYLGPLVMIARASTRNERVVWLSVLIFYLANWVGQDYFSPQGFNYFLFLAIFGILLTWFRTTLDPAPMSRLPWYRPGFLFAGRAWVVTRITHAQVTVDGVQSAQRAFLMTLVLGLFVVDVASHQLTPFAVLAGVSAAVVLGLLTPRSLPLFMALAIGTWAIYMATDFLLGHLSMVTGNVGSVNSNVHASVTRRLQGSVQHQVVVDIRLALTGLVWALAGVGTIRRLRRGYIDAPLLLLAFVPILLVGVQSYGGELLLRSYFFSLPFSSVLAAMALVSGAGGPWQWRQGTVVTGIAVLLVSFFGFARYGNERMDYFTPQEIAGVQRLYALAPPGSLLIGISYNLPWEYKRYEQYRYLAPFRNVYGVLRDAQLARRTFLELLDGTKYPRAFLIVTRSEQAEANLFGGLPPNTLTRIQRLLAGSPGIRLVYRNRDVAVYQGTRGELLRLQRARRSPGRDWTFAGVRDPVDRAALRITNRGSRAARIQVWMGWGQKHALVRTYDVRGGRTSDLRIPRGMARAALRVDASRPILPRRLIVTGSSRREMYGQVARPLHLHTSMRGMLRGESL